MRSLSRRSRDRSDRGEGGLPLRKASYVQASQQAKRLQVRRTMPSSSRHFVYGLRSLSQPGRYYTGLASDVGNRLRRHNGGLVAHTSKFRPWELVVAIEFFDEERAVSFEKYLKSGSGRAFAKRHFGAR